MCHKKSLLLKTLFTSERRPLFCWWDRVRFLGCEQQDRANLCVPKRVMESCSGGHGIKEKPEKNSLRMGRNPETAGLSLPRKSLMSLFLPK